MKLKTVLTTALAIFVVLASTQPSRAVVHDSPFLRGDSNNDGSVDIFDGTELYAWLVLSHEQPSCLAARDANDDGQVDQMDVLHLLQWALIGGAAPSAPFPDCEMDPTPDNLSCVESSCAPE